MLSTCPQPSEPVSTTLDLLPPPSVNKLRRLNKAAIRDLAAWQQKADKLVTAQWAAARFRGEPSRPSFAGQAVEITVEIAERVRLDPDNIGKGLLDYLCRIEVISDDRAKFVRRLVFEIVENERAPEGIRVTVAPASSGQSSADPIGSEAAEHPARPRGHSVPQKGLHVMVDTRQQLREPPPLPADIKDWTRHIKAERSFNDLVEEIHRELVSNASYRALLHATYDAQAVEGSLAADNVLAAMMIRDYAKTNGGGDVANEKLAIINLALGVVLRRYRASRKQRRNELGGEIVPPENDE